MENSPLSELSPGAEIAPADDASFESILSQFEREHSAAEGQTLRGTVVSVTPEAVFVDIGRKMDGVLPVDRIPRGEGIPEIRPGDIMLVNVTGRDEEGNYQLSTVRVERPKDWSAFERAFAEKLAIAGTVQEVIKGGLRVDCGVKAFLPASRSGARDQAEMEKLVGQEIQCRIIKLDTATEDVVLDRRAILEEEAAKEREQAFASLAEGMVVTGRVRSLTDFGAFVEIAPGVDGLLHVADMAWTRVNKPSDLLKAGDSIEVKILKIQPGGRKVSLGRKQLMPDPWTLAAATFKTGDRVRGKVARLMDFGAFVELMPGVEGLIHISEMSWSKKVRKPGDLLQAGEQVEVVVLAVNAAEKRIGLGLKQALGDPWEEAETKFAPGAVVEGPVTSVTNFGAFVDLGGGIEGMIHISDITREKRLDHARSVLSVGQTVKAAVIELDRAKRRIRLSMKQLEPTPADEFIAGHQVGETVTGRIVDVSSHRLKVELDEGVVAECRLSAASPSTGAEPTAAPAGKADLSSLTAMLTARWKEGAGPAASPANEGFRSGQTRTFRIAAFDPAKRKIDLEIAG